MNDAGVKSTDLKKKVKRVKAVKVMVVEKTEEADEQDEDEDDNDDADADDAESVDIKPKKRVGKKAGAKRERPVSAGSDSPDEVVPEPKKKRARKE